MKLKFKLSLMVIGIMTVVIAGIAVLLLNGASGSTHKLSVESLQRLASERAEWWAGREDGYMRVIKTLANEMAGYEESPVEIRRDMFDAMLKNTLIGEPNMIILFTVWKPNALDGMDSRYIGRTGSTATGQYAMAYTRENGEIEGMTSLDVENSMNRINGPLARIDRIDNVTPWRKLKISS